jgi:hypothetical protein
MAVVMAARVTVKQGGVAVATPPRARFGLPSRYFFFGAKASFTCFSMLL